MANLPSSCSSVLCCCGRSAPFHLTSAAMKCLSPIAVQQNLLLISAIYFLLGFTLHEQMVT
jgi:hypothetical protein